MVRRFECFNRNECRLLLDAVRAWALKDMPDPESPAFRKWKAPQCSYRLTLELEEELYRKGNYQAVSVAMRRSRKHKQSSLPAGNDNQ